jgi:eukaryotic-like serine/threonine-protein kinase
VVLETRGSETLEHSARRIAAGQIAVAGVQLASALRYLHAEGVLHLDVKPSNAIADGTAAKVPTAAPTRRADRHAAAPASSAGRRDRRVARAGAGRPADA